MGRNKKDMPDKKTNILRVMLTAADRMAIDAAAKRNHMETSTWVRLTILEKIKNDEKESTNDKE